MNCKHCQKLCKNKNSLRNHERMCKNNPNKQLSYFSTHKIQAWNKGLTKKTDERVLNLSFKTKVAMKRLMDSGYRTVSQTQEFWTPERRKAKSEFRLKLHKENPESHPNRKLAGNKSKMTYPERVAADWFDFRKIHYQHNKKVGRFYPDFIIGNIIVEIDGSYFHNVEYDKVRDAELISFGYKIYRIKSTERIEDRLENIFGAWVKD